MSNLYEPHYLMIDSGTFWRCDHGETGYFACWRCGLQHPDKLMKDIKEGGALREEEYDMLNDFLIKNSGMSIHSKKTLNTLRKVLNAKV